MPINGTILSDIEILERLVAVDGKCIFISPLIDPRTQLGPSSIDLRLGYEIEKTRTTMNTHIDLSMKDARSAFRKEKDRYFENKRIEPNGSFVLHPGTFILASTLEYIRLPSDIAGRLEGRSSLGRLGLEVHATAGFVDPGFEGNLTYELKNAGNLPVTVFPGIRLGQICFFHSSDVQIPYSANKRKKYARSLGTKRTYIEEDPEIS